MQVRSLTRQEHEISRVTSGITLVGLKAQIRFFTKNRQHCELDFLRDLDPLLNTPCMTRQEQEIQGDHVPSVVSRW